MLRNTVWQFLKKLNTELVHDPLIPLLSTHIRKMKTGVETKTCTRIFTAAIFTAVKKNIHNSNIHNPNVHQQINGYIKCDVNMQWNVIQPQKGMEYDICYNMDEPQKYYAEQIKPDKNAKYYMILFI